MHLFKSSFVYNQGEHCDTEFNREEFQNNAVIIDAMAVIQALKGKWKTFGELCDAIFYSILKLAREWKATRIDFVADRYPAISIKNPERARRAGNAGVQKVHVFSKEQNVPKQWKKFLSLGENKESLISFLCEHWRSYTSSRLGNLAVLYATSKEKCYSFSRGIADECLVVCNEVLELESNHEEADTRLLLHAKHAAVANDRVIIKSPDTDVFLLCILMQRAIGKDVYFMTGTGNRFRLIDIQAVVETMDEKVCQCLPGFHAFSGCDSTSSFYGKGKKSTWDTLVRNPEYIDIVRSLGITFSPSDDMIAKLNKFVCLMYGDKTSEDVNKCRFALFKQGKCYDDQLPPTCDSLLQHIRRANYQAAIWLQSLDAELTIPPIDENGWRLYDGELHIVWMTTPPAPDSLLECINCGCKTGCKTQRCSCMKGALQCTDVCTCVGCTNGKDSDEPSEVEDDIGLDTDEEDQ